MATMPPMTSFTGVNPVANPAAKAFTGKVIVGDIGCPLELIAAVAQA